MRSVVLTNASSNSLFKSHNTYELCACTLFIKAITESSPIISVLNLAIGVVVGIVVVVLIEEGIHYLIRRAAKAAGTNSTVIRDI